MINIGIVDDHPMVRRGLSSVLSLDPNIKIVGEASSIHGAVDMISNFNPEIAFIDLKLADGYGLDIINKIMMKNLSCKFVVLTFSTGYEDFKRAEDAGVYGYISKEALPEEILYAVKLVSNGRKYFDSNILQRVMDRKENNSCLDLTPREREVLIELGNGLSNADIARTLYITEYTVKKHVSQILSKLNLADRTQAALFASAHGLVDNVSRRRRS